MDSMRHGNPRHLRLGVALALAALLFASCSALHAADAQPGSLSADALAARVDKYYNGLHSLQANFTESYEGMGIHREERGTLLLRKPGKMRWNYADPAGKVFILSGDHGWFYSPGDSQAERLAVSQMDDIRSPLRFLLGHSRIAKEMEGLSLSATTDGFDLSGVPKGLEKRVAKITLGVTAEGVIESIRIEETDGASTAFHFTGNQANVAAPDSDFVFHPPAGVPVVDGLPPV